MSIIYNILISAVVALAGAWGVYTYAPQSIFEIGQSQPSFGSTITTIQGTDTLSSSRTTINNNFANLNTDVVNMTGSTTNTTLTSAANLATIGTIVSGIWHGTKLDVTYGGTGSSTLAQYNVLLGSSTNPIGIVQGLGSVGQFLTSNGTGLPPSWQTAAIDQTASYNWTGTYFGIKNLLASSTAANPITLNTVAYNTPAIQGASSTVLQNNGSGTLNWIGVSRLATSTATPITLASSASSTIFSFTLPANTLGKRNVVHIRANFSNVMTDSATNVVFGLRYGTGAAFASSTFLSDENGTGNGLGGYLDAYITADGASNAQKMFITYRLLANPTLFNGSTQGFNQNTSAIDSTSNQTITLKMQIQRVTYGSITFSDGYAEILEH